MKVFIEEGVSIHKKSIVAVCFLVVILFSGCVMDEGLEKLNNRETLIVLKWQFGIPEYKVRNDVLDEELIKEVNDFFEIVDWEEDDDNDELVKEVNEASPEPRWDWQEYAEESLPFPQFQIGNYEVWLIDQFVYARDIEKDRYAKLTGEDAEFIVSFLVRIGVAD